MRKPEKRILVVSDQESFETRMRQLFQGRYGIDVARCTAETLRQNVVFQPNLAIVDGGSPDLNAHEICDQLSLMSESNNLQVVCVLQTDENPVPVNFEVSADEVVSGSVDDNQLLTKIRMHLMLQDAMTCFLPPSDHNAGECYETEVECLIAEQSRSILSGKMSAFTLAMLAEYGDDEMTARIIRTRYYSAMLARQLRREGPYASQIDLDFVQNLYRASALHDIGMLGMNAVIGQHESAGDPSELVSQHTVIGAVFLEQAALQSPQSDFLAMAADIARWHHARFDGDGPAAGRSHTDIPLAARIVHLADYYDALTTADNPRFTSEQVRTMIVGESGRRFDPVIVEAFGESFVELLNVQRQLNEGCPVVEGAVEFLE